MTPVAGCALCAAIDPSAALLVAETSKVLVVRVVDSPDFPAFYRVIWRDHVVEMSDLGDADRASCGDAVTAVERLLRRLLPTKINLAALGNVVPHLHWHVIARFDWDSHFPQPIWGTRQRIVTDAESRLSIPLLELDRQLHDLLAAWGQ